MELRRAWSWLDLVWIYSRAHTQLTLGRTDQMKCIQVESVCPRWYLRELCVQLTSLKAASTVLGNPGSRGEFDFFCLNFLTIHPPVSLLACAATFLIIRI